MGPVLSKGQRLVGIDFNPAGDPKVRQVKEVAAELIDLIDQNPGDARCKNVAITGIEDAAMWAVKALTRPPEKA